MKKYIKASDGSFVSFAKKDKKTFKPVSAACGGKKSVKGNEEADKCKFVKMTIDEADKQSHDILDYDDGELKDMLEIGEREIGGKFLGFTADDDHWFVFEDEGVPTAFEAYQGRWYPRDDVVIVE